MRTKVLMWMAASAMVLTLSQPASADLGRTVVVPFEFYAIGHGDVGGFCLNDPTAPVPPEAAAFQSCAGAVPQAHEDHVTVTVKDSAGQPVYFTVQQADNPNFAGGCGTLQWGDLSAGGLFPNKHRNNIVVSPWAGAGINNVLDPGGRACIGSLDTEIVRPGTTGTVTFTFHDHVALSDNAVTRTFEFYALGHGGIGGVCLDDSKPPVPPEADAFQSCVAVSPPTGADHVGITVVDSQDQPVYFTVQQRNNPNFAWGCGRLQGGDVVTNAAHPGELLFPISGAGPGGVQASDVVVIPWPGPGVDEALEPGGGVCTNVDPFLVLPGRVGTVMFTFYDHVP